MAGAMDQQAKHALKRLNSDYKEIQKSPIVGVSASPLEKDIFEWHCNFEFQNTVYHVVMYFPKNYPSVSPSAEFVPGFDFSGGATKRGPRGGTQVCLSIFSDFAFVHTEWAGEKGTGWSPSYTAQTVLLNLLSFIVETSSGGGYYSYGNNNKSSSEKAAKEFKCSECGHTHDKPFPPLAVAEAPHQNLKYDELTCYATRLNLLDAKNEIFGFGISRTGNDRNPTYSSPCEYITKEGFDMLKMSGKVESVMREEIQFFLPLYINKNHGSRIKQTFEECIGIIGGGKFSHAMVLNIIPKLMNSAVVAFMNGTTHTSERALHGYFALHRLFMWASVEYKLVNQIDAKLKAFVDQPEQRLKHNTPNLGDWLTYLSVSPNARWEHVNIAVLKENFLRNVMWYLKENPSLSKVNDPAVNKTRLQVTFDLTKVSRDLTAFQALFLDIAKPKDLSLEQVAERYDNNNGLPTEEMEKEMAATVKKIKGGAIKSYPDWFQLIKVPCPPQDKMMELLITSVNTASTTDGYYYKAGGGGGGGRGGSSGGRGGGGGGGRGGRGRGGY